LAELVAARKLAASAAVAKATVRNLRVVLIVFIVVSILFLQHFMSCNGLEITRGQQAALLPRVHLRKEPAVRK
jgi:hypothetical protein